MLVSLGASFLATAIYVVYDMRAQKKKLDGVDPSIVLTAADMHIDEPIASALTEGRIRLISCKWLMDEDGGGTLKNIASGTLLPEEAYLGGEESLALLRKGDRSILVLSYAWETLSRPIRGPDPQDSPHSSQHNACVRLRNILGRPLCQHQLSYLHHLRHHHPHLARRPLEYLVLMMTWMI